MTGKRRPIARAAFTGAGFAALLGLCAFFLAACSPSDPKAGFSLKLKSVDSLIADGEDAKALKKLAALRTSASSAVQWLSIAKRERSLDKYDRAETTLRTAARMLPANEILTAVLADTLIRQNKYTEAAGFTDILRSTRYTPLASYAGILGGDRFADLGASDPQWWKWAFEATENPLFARNATVMHAVAGNFAAACGLLPGDAPVSRTAAPLLPDNAYFNALLCHDAQYYDRVFDFLPLADLASRTPRELSLMADTATRIEDMPRGRLLWSTLALRDPAYSPIPYYNLSVTSENAHDEKTDLEACLSLFPSYYPAVVRYVRSVPPAKGEEMPDPVAGELERAGFRTLDAEEGLLRAPVDAKLARAALERALAAHGGTVSGDAAKMAKPTDIRLQIEAFRFDQSRQSDTIRSASQMWKLLETTANDPVVHRYAIWYFASIGNFDSSFTLNQALKDRSLPFYTALEAAASGDLARAETEFARAADSAPDAWQALANIARIRAARHDYAAAVEDLSVATGLAGDDRIKSALQYESAVILVEMRMNDRAASIAGYALELDPSNYRAALLLKEIEAIR